jgi:hypothetical protein
MPDIMNPEDPNAGLVKIRIPLLGSALESGFESESVWAEPLADGTYRVWNVPVYAYNIEMRDIVKCRPDPDGGLPVVSEVVESGDCYSIRLYFEPSAPDEQIEAVMAMFSERDALLEKGSRELWAVGLRSMEDFEWAGSALEPLVDAGVLEFESAFQPEEPSYEPSR